MAEEAKMDEREGQELFPVLPALPVEYQLFILWVQSERKLLGREEYSGNPEGGWRPGGEGVFLSFGLPLD